MYSQRQPSFEPRDPDFDARVRASFARQRVMTTFGGALTAVEPGRVVIEAPFRQDLTQQHGFLHAGVVTTLLDSACGYAALSLMPKGAEVLTTEYKANFVAPARGARFVACGQVVRSGRTLTVCTGDVFAFDDSQEILITTMLATMMALPNTSA